MWWVIYIVRDNEWITTWQASLALRRTTEQKSVGWLCVSWNIFFYFKPTHLKHTTSAILMHTHTASPLSRLFLMKFLFPLSPVNLSFSADYMETLSDFQLNRPLVSAQNSQIIFFFFPSPPTPQNKNSAFGTSAVFILGCIAPPGPEKVHLCADGQLLGLGGPLPRWILILSIHQHKLTI